MALSLGGYHAPRAAAFEPRFKCASLGAPTTTGARPSAARYEAKEQRLPVPHYWDHVAWVFGKSSVEEVIEVSGKLSLRGILDRIKCPILVSTARTIARSRWPGQAPGRGMRLQPEAELHVQTLADGGAEHCGIDNVALTREVITDWIAEVLGGHTALAD